MNISHLERRSPRSRMAVGVAGSAATAAVAALLAGAASVPAHGAPANWQPAPPDVPVILLSEKPRPRTTRNCFMGRHQWPTADVGYQPQCEVER